jgi:SAM-dependent methyltransferase
MPPRRRTRVDPRQAQSFDRLAEVYDRQKELAPDPVDWLTSALPPGGGTALDLGCGAGRHSVLLAERYRQVLAVDLSPSMIALAAGKRARGNITYQVGDLFDVSGAFDLVISSAMLHHVPDIDRALAHIRGLVAPGGLAVLQDVVAPRPRRPRWWWRLVTLVEFGRDLRRRRAHPWQRLRLENDPQWIAHLASDRYLSAAGFERIYRRHFPGAAISTDGVRSTCTWHCPPRPGAAS